MPTDLLTALMGAATVVLAVAVSVPQLRALATGQGTGGLSLPALACSTVSFAAWTVHAIDLLDPWLIASSAVGVPGQAVTTWLAWRRGASRRGLWVPATWAALVSGVLAADLLLDTGVAGPVVGGSILWLVVPAGVTAWRSQDVSGIAAGTWWVLVGEGALFLGYGLAAGVLASVVYGVVCLVGSGAVLARLAVARRRPRLGDRRIEHRLLMSPEPAPAGLGS
jgi:uncharacterized protein with PQ loop repeat